MIVAVETLDGPAPPSGPSFPVLTGDVHLAGRCSPLRTDTARQGAALDEDVSLWFADSQFGSWYRREKVW